MSRCIFAFLLGLCLFGLALVEGSDIATCGGFVQASPELAKFSDKKIDYSAVRVSLITTEGLLKYNTECAPNGYYFVPIYDKGTFLLKIEGPDGWNFEPSQVTISINDEKHSCDDDINFRFTGFSLSGRVEGASTDSCQAPAGVSGPAGVEITLTNEGGGSSKTLTNRDGTFFFGNVFPGKHSIAASHSSFSITNSPQEVTVGWGSHVLSQPFSVSGYTVSGQILGSSEPVSGVSVFLYYPAGKAPTIDCTQIDSSVSVPADRSKPLCVAQSGAQGRFQFSNIPCGSYLLVPFYRTNVTNFDVVPAELPVSIQHDSTQISQPFQVMGFSVTGRVVNRNGDPISGATIFVDGNQRATSDENGYFRLERVNTGKYSIEVSKPHMFFHTLKNFQLSPAVPSLPEITVTKYHVCGVVDSGDHLEGRSVHLSGDQLQLNSKTDKDGKYCFEVPPSSYTIKADTTDAERAKGVLVSPSSRQVVVSTSPLLNVDFSQKRVSISGRVECLQTPCDQSVKVSLTQQGRQNRVTVSLGADTAEANGFIFLGVAPGQYKLTVFSQDAWCWDSPSFDVKVEFSDIAGLAFRQSGYLLSSVLSHDIVLNLTMPDSNDAEKSFTLAKGTNQFCVAKPGIYKVKPVSCYRFDQEIYTFDTHHPRVLELQAIDSKAVGQILVQRAERVASIPVQVRSMARPDADYDEEEVQQISAVFVREDGPNHVYEYSFWTGFGERFEITPLPSQSTGLLFYPRSTTFSVVKECPRVEPLNGRPGVYRTGSVTPAIAGVTIVVDSPNSSVPRRTVVTDSKGQYRVGPLYDDEKLTLTAVADGYHFVREKDNFRAVKLGEIVVRVVDQDNQPLPAVLLSLSGEGYRSNNATDAQGSFVFANLFAGQYYLRPILKEYQFNPSSKTINVEEGAAVSETFRATRVAYSVFGSVRSLNGEPEKNVVVEAIGSNDRAEETATDATGAYRLRGLFPDFTYQVRVKAVSNSLVERSSPVVVAVPVSKSDTHNVDFVVFRKTGQFDITGSVNTSSEWLGFLEVEVALESSPKKIIKSAPLSEFFNFFEFPALPEETYVVRVKTSLSQRTHEFQSQEVTVQLHSHQHVVLTFSAELKNTIQEQPPSSFFTLLLAFAGFIALFYKDKISKMIADYNAPPLVATQDFRTVKINKRGKNLFSL